MAIKDVRVYQKGDKITEKQERWIAEYLKCKDFTTASRNAGYNGNNNTLRSIGYQNSIKFKELLKERKEAVVKQIQSDCVAELEDIFKFWTETFTNDDLRLNERLKASELLAKAKGGFIEKVEVKEVNTDWFIEDDKD